MKISTVRFRGRAYQVILDPTHGYPMEIKREGASKHRLGYWIRIWHRRQGAPGRQSIVVAGVLRILEQMTASDWLATPAEARTTVTIKEAGADRRHVTPINAHR